jgi:tetratricopeptide (TPR) repeat protein
MRKLLFFLSSLMFVLAKAQMMSSYAGFGDEKYVLKEYKKDSASKNNMVNGYSMNRKKTGDTLIININGPSKQVRKLTFKTDAKYCDFDQLLMYSCDSCTRRQIEAVLEDKQMRWHKVAENKYLSKWFWKTELTITKNIADFCTAITFRCPDLDKNEYKRMYETVTYEAFTYETGKEEDDWYNKGCHADKKKEYEKAIEYYTKAIELNPKFRAAYNNRGVAKYDLKRYKEAIEDYNKAIALFADDFDAYFNRGNAKYDLEHYLDAIEDYRKALELRPNDKQAKIWLEITIDHLSK